jgi:hypothetical protein
MYPEEPYSAGGWSELSSTNRPSDMKAVGAVKPFRLLRGEVRTFTVAYIFNATDNGSTRENLEFMRNNIKHIRGLYDKGRITGISPESAKGSAANSSPEVYPNPASDNIFIRLHNSGACSLHLCNELGREVYSVSVAESAAGLRLNTSGLAAGVYILFVKSKEGTACQKIVVSR